MEIVEYAKDRDEAIVESIKADSLEPFKAFIEKYSAKYPSCFELPSDEVLSISIRQMCLHCVGIDHETKGIAVDWLTSRGYHLDFTEEW